MASVFPPDAKGLCGKTLPKEMELCGYCGAAQGDMDGIGALGWCYEDGVGMAKDYEKASANGWGEP